PLPAPTPATAPPAAGGTRWPEGLAWAVLSLALPIHVLVKINPFDVPWHLATARLAANLGRWPTHNAFSYTFPDHPVYQQYPAFQLPLYALYQAGGWAALSI